MMQRPHGQAQVHLPSKGVAPYCTIPGAFPNTQWPRMLHSAASTYQAW